MFKNFILILAIVGVLLIFYETNQVRLRSTEVTQLLMAMFMIGALQMTVRKVRFEFLP